MTTQARTGRTAFRWMDLDGPIVWLAYLPFFFVPWFFKAPTTAQAVGALVGLAVFLGLYLWSGRTEGGRLIACATAVLAVSFALVFTGGNWVVVAVYAAAMIGELRPPRQAMVWLALFAAATLAVGAALREPVLYWGPGVLILLMVGIACISRRTLADKNQQLARAQDEVRHMAATAERERIGRDLHDLLGRSLTLIAIKADLAARLASRDAAAAGTEMREVAGAAREALAEVRAAVAGLTGASLSRELTSARTALAAAGIGCTIEGDADLIERGAGAVFAMTLREAITNVIRHSGARSCRIGLVRRADGLQLVVSDDGDGSALQEGGGIAGVRSRLAAAGGGLEVRADARGTQLVAHLPAGVTV